MASVRVRIDPDAIAAAGSTLAAVAQRMADNVAVLEATVAGPGNPWGDDESGTVFAVAYQAVLGHALGALGAGVEQVGSAALALTVQARAIAAVDAEAGAALAAPAASLAGSSVTGPPVPDPPGPALAAGAVSP